VKRIDQQATAISPNFAHRAEGSRQARNTVSQTFYDRQAVTFILRHKSAEPCLRIGAFDNFVGRVAMVGDPAISFQFFLKRSLAIRIKRPKQVDAKRIQLRKALASIVERFEQANLLLPGFYGPDHDHSWFARPFLQAAIPRQTPVFAFAIFTQGRRYDPLAQVVHLLLAEFRAYFEELQQVLAGEL